MMYNITKQHLAIINQIEANDGEITEDIENALTLTQEEFQEQAISVAFAVKKFEDDEEVISKEIKRLQELKEAAGKRKELFKKRLDDAMKFFGVTEIKTPTLKLSYRKSEAVEITDENAIPVIYQNTKTVVTADKTMIKAAIKEGANVPGAVLITKENLQIK